MERAYGSAINSSIEKIFSIGLLVVSLLADTLYRKILTGRTARLLRLKVFRLRQIIAPAAWLFFFSYHVCEMTPSTFTLMDLGGGTIAIDIDSRGELVGPIDIPNDSVSAHPFVWNNRLIGNTGMRTNLGTLSEKQYSYANAVNDRGQIVGYSGTTGTDDRAWLYSNEVMTELGTLGGTESKASDINNQGHVVGSSGIPGSNAMHGFLYKGGNMVDLGTLGGDSSNAIAINNRGTVVGVSSTAGNSTTRAFLYDGSMTAIGTLGGDHSSAYDVNDSGEIVGTSHIKGNLEGHAFLYTNGSMRDIDTLGGSFSQANGINNRGQVVGAVQVAGEDHAFLWDASNGMMDINPAGWSSSLAHSINDEGLIVGQGTTRDGLQHGYLLTPVSPVPALLLLGSALTALGWLGQVKLRK
ncbi:MAG: DUF3466 family protein [Acidobacteria bacterium]|nr:DUF3466 family protein [Acidobacteriota bacterium]